MQSAQNIEQANPEKTPETISKAVASLPPEQMFELLKQMKQCVQVSNNSKLLSFLFLPLVSLNLLSIFRTIR